MVGWMDEDDHDHDQEEEETRTRRRAGRNQHTAQLNNLLQSSEQQRGKVDASPVRFFLNGICFVVVVVVVSLLCSFSSSLFLVLSVASLCMAPATTFHF